MDLARQHGAQFIVFPELSRTGYEPRLADALVQSWHVELLAYKQMKQTTSQKRTGGRSARVREAVIQAALEELTTKGYEQFSIGNVARCADMHETSVYRRWGTREGLILDTLHAAHAHHPAPDTGSLYADLCQLLLNSRAWLQSPLGCSLMQFAASIHPANPSYEVMRELWRHRMPALEAIFARAIERGEWQPEVPFRLRLDAMLGVIVWRVNLIQDEVTESQVQELVSILCRDGLARGKGPGARTAEPLRDRSTGC